MKKNEKTIEMDLITVKNSIKDEWFDILYEEMKGYCKKTFYYSMGNKLIRFESIIKVHAERCAKRFLEIYRLNIEECEQCQEI